MFQAEAVNRQDEEGLNRQAEAVEVREGQVDREAQRGRVGNQAVGSLENAKKPARWPRTSDRSFFVSAPSFRGAAG